MWEYLSEAISDMVSRRWKGTSRAGVAAEEIFFVLFMLYAFSKHGGYLFIDNVNLPIHEGGHLLFGWFGNRMLTIWGGTILQWAVPLMLAIYFFTQRQIYGFAFCLFFFFENWLYTATYMADARAMVLPLVTVGNPDMAEHDWNTIFTWMGVLQYDTVIGGVVRFGGWLGMLGTSVWLAEKGLKNPWFAEPTEVFIPK